jgi:outer membrane protein assembly factor BamE (lipoprotein component of BamABCDE complex)
MLSPYRIDVRQGNFVTQDMVAQLKPGLSREQVRFILGSPLVADMFHADRWDYVYRFQPGHGEASSARLTVFFQDNKLTRVPETWSPRTPPRRKRPSRRQDHRHPGTGRCRCRQPGGQEVRHGKDPLRHCRQFRAHGPHPDRGRAAG